MFLWGQPPSAVHSSESSKVAISRTWMDDTKPQSSRGLAIIEWLLLAVLIGTFVVLGFIPAWHKMNTDFPNYYIAAAIHRQGIPLDRAYEWRWFQRHKDYLQIDQPLVGFAPHPPLCALPMLPLASLPPLEAKRVWLVLNLGFLALALWFLGQVTQLPWRRVLLLAFLCILPLRENFLYGQYYLLILLLLCAAYYAAQRGRNSTSGTLLAAAASLKIFPVFFLILFVRKRNWRAVAGLAVAGASLAALSIAIFGWNVHKIYLDEVLPRALHGELVGPYVLQWNSFTALCHRLFLSEPEWNPAPWFASVTAYALVQALLATILLFSFLLSTGDDEDRDNQAWEWATYLPLLILLSSMPTAYHHCILIFTAIVGIDLMLRSRKPVSAVLLVICYAITCYPLPGFAWLTLQGRLVAGLLVYLILLFNAPARSQSGFRRLGFAVSLIFFAGLSFSNLRMLRNRDAGFSRRLPPVSVGYGSFSVEAASDRLIVDEMVADSFAAVSLPDLVAQKIPASGDVLAIAASPQSANIYFELTNSRSEIFRLPASQLTSRSAMPEFVAEGHDPAISPDGHWLAFLGDEQPRPRIWISQNGAPPSLLGDELPGVLEMTLTNGGDLIVAANSAAVPGLFQVQLSTHTVRPMAEIAGAVRYPALAPDQKWLAFSRRESGAWHLYARDLASGTEHRLTSAACNATSPSWQDEHTILYVTDCGRGLGLGAPARVSIEK